MKVPGGDFRDLRFAAIARGWRRGLLAVAPAGSSLLAGCAPAGGGGTGLLAWFDFSSYPLLLNLGLFLVSGALVWLAGTRLSRYVNEISERTGAGKAFLGALLLGGVTSLPEVATTITSAVAGEPELAVNNIFGSIAINVLLLAVVADVADGGRALTALVQQSTLILQGALSVLVIAVAAAAAMLSDYAVLGVGVGSAILFVVAVVAFYLTQRFQAIRRWVPVGPEGDGGREGGKRAGDGRRLERALDQLAETLRERGAGAEEPPDHRARAHRLRAEAHREMAHAHQARAAAEAERAGRTGGDRDGYGAGKDQRERESPEARAQRQRKQVQSLSTTRIVLYTVLSGAVILIAGFFLSRSGSGIAAQTGLGQSFVGFLLLAFATSLPEISTLISSVRLREFSLVFSEIFGTNIFNSTIIFYTDLVYRDGPLLQQVGRFAQVAALLGIVLTCVYIAGLVTRSEDTSVGRLGKDSLTVVALYAMGVVVLYLLR